MEILCHQSKHFVVLMMNFVILVHELGFMGKTMSPVKHSIFNKSNEEQLPDDFEPNINLRATLKGSHGIELLFR